MDQLDKQLMNLLQKGFPISERPFKDVAATLNSTEQEVITRVQAMLDSGLLTRFGPMFDAACWGGDFTLAAMEVPDDRFEAVNEIVNGFEQIAHNYQRTHRLNMWFVIGTETSNEIFEVIKNIEQATGLPVFNMPKEHEFFVGLYLPA